MCDPILVTLLKMRPQYGRYGRENATPSSGTSPLASYRKYPPPPGSELTFMVNNANLFMISAFFRFLTYVVGLLVVFVI